jgi:hypothetical protein
LDGNFHAIKGAKKGGNAVLTRFHPVVSCPPALHAEQDADQRREQLGGSDQNDFQEALLSRGSALTKTKRRHGNDNKGFQNDQHAGRQKKGEQNAEAEGGKGDGEQAVISSSISRQKRSHSHIPLQKRSLLQNMRDFPFGDGFDEDFAVFFFAQ